MLGLNIWIRNFSELQIPLDIKSRPSQSTIKGTLVIVNEHFTGADKQFRYLDRKFKNNLVSYVHFYYSGS